MDIGSSKTRAIQYLPKEKITHETIFNLWFKDYSGNWFRVTGYEPSKNKFYFALPLGFTRDELLKMDYANYPREAQ